VSFRVAWLLRLEAATLMSSMSYMRTLRELFEQHGSSDWWPLLLSNACEV
jgi:ribosomal protein L20